MKITSFLERMGKLLRGESGQALAETALMQAFMITTIAAGTYSLIQFMPDMFAAISAYVRGFYLILSYPVG